MVQHAAQPPRYCLLLSLILNWSRIRWRRASLSWMLILMSVSWGRNCCCRPANSMWRVGVRFRRRWYRSTALRGWSKLFPQSRRFGRYNLTYLDIDQRAESIPSSGVYAHSRRRLTETGLLDTATGCTAKTSTRQTRQRCRLARRLQSDVVAWHVKRASSKQNSRAHPEFYRAMLIFTTSTIVRRHASPTPDHTLGHCR